VRGDEGRDSIGEFSSCGRVLCGERVWVLLWVDLCGGGERGSWDNGPGHSTKTEPNEHLQSREYSTKQTRYTQSILYIVVRGQVSGSLKAATATANKPAMIS
jgi:hypothetical protein